jgi:uncharacterized membrane protein
MAGLNSKEIIFLFFFFSVSGWIGESLMESLVRRRLVSKGFFRGPYVPVHGIGAFAVYLLCTPVKDFPFLVFVISAAACTLIEYLAALLLENFFHIRGWDYDTYPFTRWCHYKKRVALTTSLFFGLVAMGVIYFYWDLGLWLARLTGEKALFVIDVICCAVFFADAAFTGTRCVRNYAAGIPNKTIGLE